MLMRYGKTLSIERNGDVTVAQEKLYTNFENTKKVCIYSHSIKVKQEKDVLAEFLNLLDRRKTDGIHNIGMQTYEDDHGQVIRIEATWQVADLQ